MKQGGRLIRFFSSFHEFGWRARAEPEPDPARTCSRSYALSLSHAVSLSSQPSLPSLPSLGPRDLNVSPCHHRCVATLRDHSSYVSALAVDGHSLYSASSDGRIRVWPLGDASGRQERQQDDDDDDGGGCGAATVVATCDSSVKCLLATAGSNGHGLLVSSLQDGKIMAWRTGSGRKDGTPSLVLRAVLPTCMDRLRTTGK
jgi:WD40 repeat protein